MSFTETDIKHKAEIFQSHLKISSKQKFSPAWALSTIFATLDFIVLQACLLFATVTRNSIGILDPIIFNPDFYLGMAAMLIGVLAILFALGVYLNYGVSPIERAKRRIGGLSLAFLLLGAWDYLSPGDEWSRGTLIFTGIFAVVLSPLVTNLMTEYLLNKKAWGKPVILLGDINKIEAVAANLIKSPELGLIPTHYINADRLILPGNEASSEGISDQGETSSESEVYCVDHIDTVLLCTDSEDINKFSPIIDDLPFIHIIFFLDILNVATLWVEPREINGRLAFELRYGLLRWHKKLLKRIIDFSVLILALPLAVPIVLVAALLVKIVSPGPAFFAQSRQGVNGVYFRMYKIRTMYIDAEKRLSDYLAKNPDAEDEWRRFYKLKDDPRIIPFFGKFFRRLSIDELPQLLNVFLCQMSIVGPRPFPDYHLKAFDDNFLNLRCKVFPGITGLWQVTSRSEGDIDTAQTRYILHTELVNLA